MAGKKIESEAIFFAPFYIKMLAKDEGIWYFEQKRDEVYVSHFMLWRANKWVRR